MIIGTGQVLLDSTFQKHVSQMRGIVLTDSYLSLTLLEIC